MQVDLPPDYYLSNFRELITHVDEQYEDLLSSPEQEFLSGFVKCSEDAQKLYVRMLMRKGQWFRLSKLNYNEIQNKHAALQELEIAALVQVFQNDKPAPLDAILPLYNKGEWIKHIQHRGITDAKLKSLKREAIDAFILGLDDPDIGQFEGEVQIKLIESERFETFKLLFFANLHQDLADFILRDLGLNHYEDYAIDKSTRVFTDRLQIEQHLHYYALVDGIDDEVMMNAEAIKSIANALPKPTEYDRLLKRRVERTCLKLARQLERLKENESALAIYQRCDRPPARERQARILASQMKFTEALQLCQEIIDTPFCEEELDFAQAFAHRSAKKAGVDWPKPSAHVPETQTISLQQSDEAVEVNTAGYYAEEGDCYYVENTLFCGLFGLTYWDVIFAPVQGAFTHPFQSRPHDLHERDFLAPRRGELKCAQQALKSKTDFHTLIHQHFKMYYGKSNHFVYWDCLDLDLLKAALANIPLHHLQAIFKRLWMDTRSNGSGFPDLILFRDEGYELIEVKGPGDRLQKNQLRWMQYFDQHHIPHKVVHVEWQ